MVVCCLAAIFDLRPKTGASETLAVAIVDISMSVGGGTPSLPEGLKVRPRWILVADGVQEVVGDAEPARLSRTGTQLGAALRRAAEIAPGIDVVLLTDGRATGPDAEAGARAVARAGGRVFVLPPASPAADLGLLDARIVAAGAGVVVVDAVVAASTSGGGRVDLLRDGRVLSAATLSIEPGTRERVTLRDEDPPAAGAAYSVRLSPFEGTPNDDRGNDQLTLGWRAERRSALLVGALSPELFAAEDLHVTRVDRLRPVDLAAADVIVLCNKTWRAIAPSFTALDQFVGSGGQLLLLGGDRAYQAGAWGKTPLEERLSPLRIPAPEGKGTAVLLLVDRSGSTSREGALEHLREAARSAVRGLAPGERIAVLPFAQAPDDTLLGPGFVERQDDRRDALLDALDALRPEGDTDLLAAIRRGATYLTEPPASERLVVLLTDGDPDHALDASDVRRVRSELDQAGVRFAALVVNDERAVDALLPLAATPEHVKLLTSSSRLRTVLDEMIRARRLDASRLPAPDVLDAGDLPGATGGLDIDGLRPAWVHVLEAHPSARVRVTAAWSDRSSTAVPFLASRAAGIGSGSVWALAWGPEAETDPKRVHEANERLRGLVHRLAGRADRGIASDWEGSEVVVRMPEASGQGRLQASSGEATWDLVEAARGIFRGAPTRAPAGPIWVTAADGVPRPLRLPARPPPEHRGVGLDEAAMARIAKAGNGVRLTDPQQVPRGAARSGPSLAPWLLLLTCILLVVDRVRSKSTPA